MDTYHIHPPGLRSLHTIYSGSRKNALTKTDLSSSLPSLAGLQVQDALEIWQEARPKVMLSKLVVKVVVKLKPIHTEQF